MFVWLLLYVYILGDVLDFVIVLHVYVLVDVLGFVIVLFQWCFTRIFLCSRGCWYTCMFCVMF